MLKNTVEVFSTVVVTFTEDATKPPCVARNALQTGNAAFKIVLQAKKSMLYSLKKKKKRKKS